MDDAAFMTGIERNSDIVTLACYAPLFAHINDFRWTPDAIYFDGLSSFGNAAWWVQHLFSVHRGDVHVPTDSDANPQKFFHVASKNTARNSIILKIVNTNTDDIFIDSIQLQGITSTKGGKLTRLSGTGAGFEDMNDISNPLKIAPVAETFAETSNSFSFNAPAWSLTIIELDL
jgi:alpha-L-arabinofuranosidase